MDCNVCNAVMRLVWVENISQIKFEYFLCWRCVALIFIEISGNCALCRPFEWPMMMSRVRHLPSFSLLFIKLAIQMEVIPRFVPIRSEKKKKMWISMRFLTFRIIWGNYSEHPSLCAMPWLYFSNSLYFIFFEKTTKMQRRREEKKTLWTWDERTREERNFFFVFLRPLKFDAPLEASHRAVRQYQTISGASTCVKLWRRWRWWW